MVYFEKIATQRRLTVRTFVQQPRATPQATHASSTIPSRAYLTESRDVRNAEERNGALAGRASSHFGCHFSLGRMLQAKLAINQPGDAYEQEADRVAAAVMKLTDVVAEQSPSVASVNKSSMPMQRKCSCGGTCSSCQDEEKLRRKATASPVSPGAIADAPAAVNEVLKSPGQPLDSAARAYFEPRFGYDFSRVRIHNDSRAAESARLVNALAYTVGENIVFGAGQHAPTASGRQLLAHELTHVLQQGASSTLRRQSSGQPTPGFSVNQASYMQMVNQAIQSMTGNLVRGNTLAPVIEPALSSLSAHVIWRDQSGKDQGGSAVSIPLPGTPTVTLKLRLVLDDQLNPRDAGEFQHKDKVEGTIAVMVRMVPDVPSLKNVLFHEGSHMLVWAIQNWGAARFAQQDRRSLRAVNLSLHTREIASIRNQLDALATSVNSRRAAAKQSPVSGKQLDETATFLMNEAVVRAETKVFELYSDTEKMLATPGPKVFVDTSKIIGIDSAMIDRYVFDFSKTFLPSDRAGLTPADHQVLDLLRDMLVGIVDLQVKRQFSVTPYMMGSGIPRAQMQLPPAQLQPPHFQPPPPP